MESQNVIRILKLNRSPKLPSKAEIMVDEIPKSESHPQYQKERRIENYIEDITRWQEDMNFIFE